MLADLIFKDPTQLDRDLLSDATREYLSTFGNPPKVMRKGSGTNSPAKK